MKPITIRIGLETEEFPGAFYVEQDGNVAIGLSWDEMLGQVASLTYGSVQERIARYGGLYRMRTPEERAAEAERNAERNANPPTNDDEPNF